MGARDALKLQGEIKYLVHAIPGLILVRLWVLAGMDGR